MKWSLSVMYGGLLAIACSMDAFGADASISAVNVLSGGARVEIRGDRPLTYVYRKLGGGPGIVVDIAPAQPQGVKADLPGAGPITGISINQRHLDGISVTSVTVRFDRDQQVKVTADPGNAARLLVELPEAKVVAELAEAVVPLVPASSKQPPSAVPAEKPAPVPVPEAALAELAPAVSTGAKAPAASVATPSPLLTQAASVKPLPSPAVFTAAAKEPPPSPTREGSLAIPVISSLAVNGNGVEVVAGTTISSYDAFRLSSPERLVVDIPGLSVKPGLQGIEIGRFGVKRLRVGMYQDKVRLVFDAMDREGVPLHIIQKTAVGLKITFAAIGRGKTRK